MIRRSKDDTANAPANDGTSGTHRAGSQTYLRMLLILGLTVGLSLPGCDMFTSSNSDTPTTRDVAGFSIPEDHVYEGCPGKDCIPARTDPPMVAPSAPGARYLDPQDRVIGVVFNNDALGFPLKGLLWHEIINLNSPGRRIAVTYCPLTGSTLAFDQSVVQGAELGVSGLLYRNNLIMYDRNSQESLWSQMKREGIKGPKKNTSLPMTPIVETTWEGWQKIHPDTKVMSSITGCPPEMWEAPPNEVNCPLNYTENPYGENYGTPNNDRLLYPMPPRSMTAVRQKKGFWEFPRVH